MTGILTGTALFIIKALAFGGAIFLGIAILVAIAKIMKDKRR